MDMIKQLQDHRHAYAKQWETTSKFFDNQGYYDWMANKVSQRHRILEIGSGAGFSTLKLARKGHSVVSIEENPECIAKTESRLKSSGFHPIVILRGKTINLRAAGYNTIYKATALELSNNITIIEGDLIDDKNLITRLKLKEKFDAVVCWLIGSHASRANLLPLYEQGIQTQPHHRIIVQDETYEISDTILKSDGVLNIIDRGEILPTSELKTG